MVSFWGVNIFGQFREGVDMCKGLPTLSAQLLKGLQPRVDVGLGLHGKEGASALVPISPRHWVNTQAERSGREKEDPMCTQSTICKMQQQPLPLEFNHLVVACSIARCKNLSVKFA